MAALGEMGEPISRAPSRASSFSKGTAPHQVKTWWLTYTSGATRNVSVSARRRKTFLGIRFGEDEQQGGGHDHGIELRDDVGATTVEEQSP